MKGTFIPLFIIVAALTLSLTWVMLRTPAPAAHTEPVASRATEQEACPSEREMSPTSRGVSRESPQKASWAVLARELVVQSSRGKTIKLTGGRFFQIERRIKDVNGLKLGCLTIDTNVFTRATIPADSLICFTGSPSDLSPHQQHSLCRYYELIAAAEKRKLALLREAARKDPYLNAAAEALAAFRRKSSELQKNTQRDIEANHQATYELSRLRSKYQELNRKHEEWKREHAAEVPSFQDDATYKNLLEQAHTFADTISGLTIEGAVF